MPIVILNSSGKCLIGVNVIICVTVNNIEQLSVYKPMMDEVFRRIIVVTPNRMMNIKLVMWAVSLSKFHIHQSNWKYVGSIENCVHIFVLFLIRWEIQRSQCSVECGEGVQQLSYTCIQTFPRTQHRTVVDDVHCPSSQKNKLYEKCFGSCASATWTYEEYDEVGDITQFHLVNGLHRTHSHRIENSLFLL